MLLLQELQRLKVKCEEALSESEGLRGECERLTATVETLRAAGAAAASGDGNNSGRPTVAVQPGMEKKESEKDKREEEIIRLQNTIEELERAREEVDVAQGRIQLDNKEEGESEELEEARRPVLEERDNLRAELGEEKQKAATRVAGLEMQLADKEVRILPN